MAEQNDFGKDKIIRLVWKLAIPALLAQFVNVLYSVVDRIYVGNIQGTGELALAGVGISAPLLAMLSAIAFLVGIGGAPLMSIQLGEGHKEGAKRVQNNAFFLLLAISVPVTIISFLTLKPMLRLFGATDSILPHAMNYAAVYVLGTPFVVIMNGMNAFVLAQGYPKRGMVSIIIGAVLNLVLDPVFIFVFGWKEMGAAVASVLSQAVSMVFVLSFFFRKETELKLEWKGFARPVMKRILQLGSSSFLIVFFDQLILMCLNAVLKMHGGERSDLFLTAGTILQSYLMILTMPLAGITGGTQAILGYNYGARESKRVIEAEKWIFIVGFLYTLLLFLPAQLIPEVFVRIFTRDEATLRLTSRAIRMWMAGVLFLPLQYMIVDGFTAMGIVRYALPLSLTRKFIFLFALFLLPVVFPTEAVFYTETISDVLGTAVSSFVFFRGLKKILKAREKSRLDYKVEEI